MRLEFLVERTQILNNGMFLEYLMSVKPLMILQDTFFVGAGSSLREYANNHTGELHGKHKKYLGKRKS